jgi:hypothetical protein
MDRECAVQVAFRLADFLRDRHNLRHPSESWDLLGASAASASRDPSLRWDDEGTLM